MGNEGQKAGGGAERFDRPSSFVHRRAGIEVYLALHDGRVPQPRQVGFGIEAIEAIAVEALDVHQFDVFQPFPVKAATEHTDY